MFPPIYVLVEFWLSESTRGVVGMSLSRNCRVRINMKCCHIVFCMMQMLNKKNSGGGPDSGDEDDGDLGGGLNFAGGNSNESMTPTSYPGAHVNSQLTPNTEMKYNEINREFEKLIQDKAINPLMQDTIPKRFDKALRVPPEKLVSTTYFTYIHPINIVRSDKEWFGGSITQILWKGTKF